MAIILRITSADGKKVMTKSLPALPAVVKVPAGGRADVIDPKTKAEVTLARWINDHSADRQRSNDDHPDQGRDYVKIETTEWDEAEAWFAALPASPEAPQAQSGNWYAAASEDDDSSLLGLDLTTILIGAAVGAGVVFGVTELSKDSKPKDKIAPAAPTGIDLAAADDTGSSSTDNITSTKTGLTISGTAEAGSTVELFDGTTSLGTVKVGADGTFSKDVDLAPGMHGIIARATDLAGNLGAPSAALVVQVDETAPAVPDTLALAPADDSGASPSDLITKLTNGLTISGKGDPNTVIELFDGTTSLGTVTVGTNGTFSKDVTLAEGSHVITAKASDAAGNASAASSAITIVVDTTVPVAPTSLDLSSEDDNGASNSDNVTSISDNLTFTGVAEAGTTVQLFDNGTAVASVTAGSNGIFTFEVDLAVGTHNITAKATDIAGNTGPTSATLAVTIIQPAASASLVHDATTSLIG